jgi:hypothetical protein
MIVTGCSDNRQVNREEIVASPVKETMMSTVPELEKVRVESMGFKMLLPLSWNSRSELQEPFTFFSVHPDTVPGDILPIRIHAPADVTFLSVFPQGYGTELPSGNQEALHRNPSFWHEDSRQFLLENGQAWAYYLKPAEPPSTWSQDGFFFLQLPVRDFNIRCVDETSSEEKTMKDCDPLLGDHVIRTGKINQNLEVMADSILQSIQWITSDDEEPITDLIRVEKPESNQLVESPLSVEGQARGYWFHEGVFSVALLNEEGDEIARTSAQAIGEWMTEDWVSFEANLEFDMSEGGSGVLVFERANPSGLAENARSHEIKVLFSQES